MPEAAEIFRQCPKCKGTGWVPDPKGREVVTSPLALTTLKVQCKQCFGTGIFKTRVLVEVEQDEAPLRPVTYPRIKLHRSKRCR
jgi:hypothetical protein